MSPLAVVGLTGVSLLAVLAAAWRQSVDPSWRRSWTTVVVTGVCLAWLGWGVVSPAVSDHVVGATTVGTCAVACLVAGWLVRVRGRHDLLTTPDASPAVAARLGTATAVTGLALLPVAVGIALDRSATTVGLLTGGAAVTCLGAIVVAVAGADR
ncbi:hypothetical protein RYH80_12620 [Halobaculum sp. MBLA0147]|uniref:hypothetical protein n=1 Tax=Halobaculum sp. MBLA0147 TaxID=3079934 RepID=UPI003524C550